MAATAVWAGACSDGERSFPSTVEGFALPDDGVVRVSSSSHDLPETVVMVVTDDSLASLRSRFTEQAARAGEKDWTLCGGSAQRATDSWQFRSFDGERGLEVQVGPMGERSKTGSHISFQTTFDSAGGDCPDA